MSIRDAVKQIAAYRPELHSLFRFKSSVKLKYGACAMCRRPKKKVIKTSKTSKTSKKMKRLVSVMCTD